MEIGPKSTESNLAPGVIPGARSAAQDRILSVIIIVLSSLFWAESVNIVTAEAKMFPRMILSAIYVLSVLLALRSFRLPPEKRGEAIFISLFPFLLFVGASAAYVASIGVVGFFTATAVYMPFIAWLLGLRKIVQSVFITTVFLIAIYVVFVLIFERPMPREIFWG